ncbi:MAG TPA: prepilin-type N-terminal cleavage/methylation domain-containing protein, partial [Lacipirellulaceae bacterium]|nr:prepilin-type N-terminal cleavage/methylation domain-containing protein [Lacipirellulaceae bacterium]
MEPRQRSKPGFSLLELLAVVTILGVIAALIVPRVTVSSAAAKTKVRDHHMATINAAVEQYF